MSNVLGVVDPKNKKYFVEMVTELIHRYDSREMTRSQLLDTLTSWQIVIDKARDIEDAPDRFRKRDYYEPTFVASLKLPQDIHNEWSGTDVTKDYAALLDKIGWKVKTTHVEHVVDVPPDPRFKVWVDIIEGIEKDPKFRKPLLEVSGKTHEELRTEFRAEFAKRAEEMNKKLETK